MKAIHKLWQIMGHQVCYFVYKFNFEKTVNQVLVISRFAVNVPTRLLLVGETRSLFDQLVLHLNNKNISIHYKAYDRARGRDRDTIDLVNQSSVSKNLTMSFPYAFHMLNLFIFRVNIYQSKQVFYNKTIYTHLFRAVVHGHHLG